MKNINLFTSIILALILTSCSAPQSMNYGYVEPLIDKKEVITQSLFDSKDRTISEDDIQRLLYKV